MLAEGIGLSGIVSILFTGIVSSTPLIYHGYCSRLLLVDLKNAPFIYLMSCSCKIQFREPKLLTKRILLPGDEEIHIL